MISTKNVPLLVNHNRWKYPDPDKNGKFFANPWPNVSLNGNNVYDWRSAIELWLGKSC